MADPMAVADRLLVATLNLRNIADRWPERIPLLLADMAALQPDLIGLQECVFAVGQDRLLGAAGDGRYASRRGWAGRPEYGNAILGREPLALGDGERIDLGRNRSALRVPVSLPNGAGLDFVVTHLHHLVPDEAIREEQARAVAAWLEPATGPLVLVGDFNAEPVEATYRAMLAAGAEAGMQLPLSEVHAAILTEAERLGLGDLDNSALIEVLRRQGESS